MLNLDIYVAIYYIAEKFDGGSNLMNLPFMILVSNKIPLNINID